ncbi:hypothetical protein [Amycolatopsis albispora]|uniref:Orc1-like AAA ATPase domain-containing protein n=1 Tax=Amycolatopsis albispora TaxID=1804986 RepID=A0A344L6W7_9PSEU|nr:hypothetical protein [Amycolatopsis albispora]AXB43791.1 hypothetical protein A4R43_15710 [Amycolatopsis albispora]
MGSSRQTHLNQSLLRIPRRAEGVDRATLSRTFVAAGSFAAMLHSTDHQILYGRRGTGKTHALRYLHELASRSGDLSVYLDLRTIGSAGGLYSDSELGADLRGTQLLVDTLEALHEELFTLAVEREVGDHRLLPALDELAEATTAVEVVGEVESATKVGAAAEAEAGLEVSSSAKLSGRRKDALTAESSLRRTGTERHRVVFGPLGRALQRIAAALGGARLWVLLDEWSSLPLELQPLLADLLRRSVLPVNGLTVKIAAIERRSRFRRRLPDGDHLGIEVGADAATAVSLDDQPAGQDEFFAELLFNHASVPLAKMLADPPSKVDSFLREVFRPNAFGELARAAEGVPRDAINIAALAAQHAHDEPIDLRDVRLAARDWYLRDKRKAIETDRAAAELLRKLIDEVVGRRRCRTFLLAQESRWTAIDDLHDARLLHLLRRGVVDENAPGTLYDGYSLDYGCYVSLLLAAGKSSRPQDRVGWLRTAKGVPPDDFRPAREVVDLAALR